MSIITVQQACDQAMNRAQRRAAGLKKQKTVRHVHVQVKEVAIGLAHALFDELMGRNEIFHQFKQQHPGMTTKQMEDKFVLHLWPQLIDQARATMAGMLRSGAYSDEMKEDIMDSLVKDATLIRGRKKPEALLGTK